MPDTKLFTPVDRRNYIINLIEGALYIAGAAFISGQTVLPALVTRLGGGNIAVGSVSVILWLGLFLPQVFGARFVETLPWKKPWMIVGGIIQRMGILMLALCVLTLSKPYPSLALAGVLLCFALNQIGLGIITPGWFDLFAKLTPAEKRGRLLGYRTSLGGALSFLCSLALTWMLARYAFPVGYTLAFFCAFILQMSSIVLQTRFVEEHASRVVAKRPFGTYLKDLPVVLHTNRQFRKFLVMSVFLVVASMPSGFFIVYALKELGGTESVVGEFTLAIVSVQVVSALVNGYINDHYGHKAALLCAAAGMLCASLLAMTASSLGWFVLVFVFLGINLGSETMIRYNMAIEYGPVEQRSMYVGLMNTALAPFYLSSIAGGWIVDRFGYHSVFALGALSSTIGILLLLFRVVNPRSLHSSIANGPTGTALQSLPLETTR